MIGVEIVRLTITGKPDYITSAADWVKNGRQPGFKKRYGINQDQIIGLEHTYMNEDEFNNLETWPG